MATFAVGGANPPLASVSQLETLLRRTFSQAERDAATQLLAGVSADIRKETGQFLSHVTGETLAIDRERFRLNIWLPQRPVTAIASITIDGELVPASAYRFDADTGEVTFSSQVGTWGTSTAFRPRATVVYSHGFDPVPDDVVAIALEMALTGVEVPGGGVESEEIGNYAVKFDVDAVQPLNDGQRRRLRRYRAVTVA